MELEVLSNIKLDTWYKCRGSFGFVYIRDMQPIYDYSGWIVKYMWIGEMSREGRNSLYCETSEFTTGSMFHHSLYKIMRPDLIPPDDVIAKCKLLLKYYNDEYIIIYPGVRKRGQMHPWQHI